MFNAPIGKLTDLRLISRSIKLHKALVKEQELVIIRYFVLLFYKPSFTKLLSNTKKYRSPRQTPTMNVLQKLKAISYFR